MLVEQGFRVKRAEEDIRRILAVYFEQNVTAGGLRSLTWRDGLF